jgi:hypothetical protein
VLEMAVGAGVATRVDAKLRRRDATTRGPFDFESRARIQPAERIEHGFGRSPGVEQRADGHIAADARECVQVAEREAHGELHLG